MPIEFLSEEEARVVRAEQIKAFFSETNDQNFAGALVLSLLVYIVHDKVPAWTWQPALFALYVVTLMRAWLVWQYHHSPARYSTADWGHSQNITGGMAGACWGVANTAMLMHLPTESQLVILTVISVVAASSASEGFSYAPPSRAFILAAIGPPTLWLLTVGDRIHTILGLMLLVFVPMTIWQAQKRNRVFIEAQQLRFRNEALVKELRIQRDAAEQANLGKARFLAAASHDLRQPMQALSIFHELLQQEPQTLPGRDLLANARQSADAMNTLLDALLDVSKLDAQAIMADCRPFPIQALLDDMAREFIPIAQRKGLRLRFRPCPATVISDRALLGQVLRNLLSNAIRYTPSGSILMGCRRSKGYLLISVFDTGIGIAEDQHQAIFSEFYQVGNQARDRQQGIGLGLAIVERVLRLLGHPLALSSVPGRGSCFAVSVPLATAGDETVLSGSATEHASARGSPAGQRILVIDDEQAIRNGMNALLHGWGYEVITAGSAAEALARAGAANEAINAVISDMGLPGPDDGIDAIVALRQRYGAHLPALLVTGDTSPTALLEAKAANLIMLHKPIKPARLRAALAEAMTANQHENA